MLAVGSAGCSGVACHGRPVAGLVPLSAWGTEAVDLERWRSSATIWACYDPHRRSFDVLAGETARQIEVRLAESGDQPLDARADIRCLACHVTPSLAGDPKNPMLAEGVGCEACHGDSRSWIGTHAGWISGPGHAAKAAAMTALWDVKVRAETCAGCHVGAPADKGLPLRDVNHDVIAAGHPRLNFDYATYLRALPPHWVEKDREIAPPTLRPASDEFRHWLVGRAVAGATALRLRADRANRGPWPELAEFDCYACHHALTGVGAGPDRLVLNWPPFGDSFGIPNEEIPSAVAWDRLAERFRAEPIRIAEVAGKLAVVKPRRWDEACQLYYAVLAIDRAADPGRLKPHDPWLDELKRALRFPRISEGVKHNSPPDFTPDGLPFAEFFRARAK
jgi:hypothetical protein